MLVLTRKTGQSVRIDRRVEMYKKVSIHKRDNIKNIIKTPNEQDKDVIFSKEGKL